MKDTKKLQIFLMAGISFLMMACGATKPFYGEGESDWNEKTLPDTSIGYTLYFAGGLDYEGSTTIEAFNLLRANVDTEDTLHAIVYLNDHIYGKKNKNRSIEEIAAEKKIDKQLEFISGDKGKVFFVAGHERIMGKNNFSGGEIRKYIEEKTGKKEIFVPSDNCPGPDDIQLTPDLVLLPLNTPYWHRDDSELDPECDIDDLKKWSAEIQEVIDDNQRKNIVAVGHHPVMSMGNYGGWFSLRQHIFPLTDLNKYLYVPLPVIGSLYPLFRIAAGFRNDRSYPVNTKIRRALIAAFYRYNDVVYVSGLERNFQYYKINKQDYMITGSSDKKGWTGSHSRMKFSYIASGILKINYYNNGQVWMEYLVPDAGSEKGTVIYRKRLKDNIYKGPKDSTAIAPSENVSDSTITIVAQEDLKAGKFKSFWLGEHYRKAWTTPVTVKLIDFQSEQGGLEIIKKGGGFQTKSLHLKNKKGEELILRSVVKYPENLLGPKLNKTIAADFIRDQTSTMHPYAAFVLEDLSEPAGVLHSDPEIRFIPNDPQLEEYRKEFANTLAVFEKRAGDTINPADHFRYVESAVSSRKLMKMMKKKNDVVIDKYALVKSRLFDMWINDWDRHQDQWKWGKVECDENRTQQCKKLRADKDYYVPIPFDRDQAFVKYDGVIPWLSSRKWSGRRFQHFHEDIRDVPGINFNARNFDHAFLSELSRSDWTNAAEELKSELTNSRIEKAIRRFPEPIYKIDGPDMIRILESRRDKITEFANRHYDYLSKYVDVVGSDENEIFEVNRIDDNQTQVKVFDGEKGEGRVLYNRTLFTNETCEVRIYGRGGDDVFRVTGNTDKGIIVRIIGGSGQDSITDNSNVKGACRKTVVYDDKEKNHLALSKETKDLTSGDKVTNDYNYFSYKYNLLAPALFFGYNRDDGVFIGGGVLIRNHGFRKDPYASRQRIVANVSLLEGSFNMLYGGDFVNVFGKWGINIDATVLAPKSITNFYGLGNETQNIVEKDEYYRLRYDAVAVYPGIMRYLGKYHSLKFGPHYTFIDVEQTPGRYITSLEGRTYAKQLDSEHFAGLRLEYRFENIDDSVLTFRGIKFYAGAGSQAAVGSDPYVTTNLESNVSLYVPVMNRAVLASRIGTASRIGDFEFYHAYTLGGFNVRRENGNLRGYLRGRYSGRTSVYFNNDLRIKLFSIQTYLFPAHIGLLGFYDTGRVWMDDESSSRWHRGYGGGIWFDPYSLAVINLTYAASKEEKLVTLTLGFLF